MSLRPRALLRLGACCASARACRRAHPVVRRNHHRADRRLAHVREVIRVRAEGSNIRRGIYRDFPTIYPAGDGRQIVVGFRVPVRDARRPAGALAHGDRRQRRARLPGQRRRDAAARRAHLRTRLSHRPADGLLRRSRRAVLERHRQRLGLPHRSGHGARGAARQTFRSADIKLEAYTGPQGAKGRNYTATIDNGAPLFATTRALECARRAHHRRDVAEGFHHGRRWKNRCPPAAGPTSSPGYNYSQRRRRRIASGRSPIEALAQSRSAEEQSAGVPRPLRPGRAALLLLLHLAEGRPRPAVAHHHPRIRIAEGAVAGVDALSHAHGLRQRVLRGRRAEPGGERASAHSAGRRHSRASARRSRCVKQAPPDAKPLSADEEQLLLNLFAEGGTLVLEQENHERVSEARTNHRLSLKERYTSGFFKINGGWHFLGIVLSILLALPALLLPGKTNIWPEWHFTTAGGLVHAVHGAAHARGQRRVRQTAARRRPWRGRPPWITSADSRCTWKWPKARSSSA